MASSLAQQLKKLQAPQTGLLLERRRPSSLLFTASEAGNYDRDVYYDIGWSGFQELLKVNADFNQFKDSLFGKASKDLQRAVEDKETNENLNKIIEHFLLLVSPYLEKQASLKAVEWLVHRFMINQMNMDALFMCIFPYYESALFVRVLQIMDIGAEGSQWQWLQNSQKKGCPLPKQTVFSHWGHSQEFRSFLSKYLRKMCKVHKTESNLKMAIAFYTSTVIGGLCILDKVMEKHVSHIMSSVPKCLQSPHNELVAGMYFILLQLNIKAKLKPEIFHTVSKYMICENSPPEALMHSCMLSILVMCHHQSITDICFEVVEAIDNRPELLQEIGRLAKTKSVAPFLSAFILGYIRWLCSETCNLKFDMKAAKLVNLLETIGGISLSCSDASQIIWSIFEAVEENYKVIEEMPSLSLGCALGALEESHPEGYSQAMAKLINWDNMHPGKKKYKLILSKVLDSGSKDSGVGFKHLVHPDDCIRLAAVQKFAKNVRKKLEKDTKLIKTQMENMLNDEYPDIVSEALLLEEGLELLDPSYIIEKCEELLQRAQDHEVKWGALQNQCLDVLCNQLANRYDEDQLMNVLYICLPYLFFLTKEKCDAARLIAMSKVTLRLPLLAALSLEISHQLKDFNEIKYRKNILKIISKAISELVKEEENMLWSFVEKQLNTHQELLSVFVSLILLRCGIDREKIKDHKCLELTHMLIDACLVGLDSDVKKTGEKQDLSKGDLGGNNLSICFEAVKKGTLSLPFIAQCLKQSVKVFKLPAVYNNNAYWTTNLEDGLEEGNILLLIKALRGAVHMERFGDVGVTLRNDLVSAILMKSLNSVESRYYFLAVIWGWHSSLKFSNYVDEALQVWSLKLGASLLKSQSSSLAWALGTSQPLVPSLLSALSSESELVRREAINCVKELNNVVGGHLTQDSHGMLLKVLLKHDEELIADNEHLSQMLSELGDKPSSSKGFHIIQCLLQVLTSEHVPVHLKVAIQYMLTTVTDKSVLVNLLPVAKSIFAKIAALKAGTKLDLPTSLSLYYILLRFSPENSGILETEAGWEIFIMAVNCSAQVIDLHQNDVSPQSILMDQIMSNKFFTSIKKEDLQVRLWSILISRVAESEDPQEASQLRKGLRKVSIDAKLIVKQIEELELMTKVTSIRAAQAKRIKQKAKENQKNTFLSWKKLGLMLETLGVMASLGRPWLLVGPLCQCLQQTFTADVAIVELAQQQLLTALLLLIQKSASELGEDCSKEVKLNVEVVVQSIRSSSSPDTHRRALLVLSFAAKIFPEVVMHNMMSIFTFMGTSLLRRDDSYSFQVIHQTIESIIPVLIKCEKQENLLIKLAQVCQVFTDALPDLPEHRRLPLFIQLADKIDSHKYLWLILAQACNMHVIRGSGQDDDKKGVPKNVQFALALSSHFSVVTQVHSCCQLMEYIINLPLEKEEGEKQNENDIINWKSQTTRQLCHFKYTCIGLIGHLLTSETFIDQVCSESDWKLGDLCQKLLEKTLCYLVTVTELCEANKEGTSGKFWSSLQRKLILVLDGINSILPPTMLLSVTGDLIESSWPVVRCRAIELLCSKLQPNVNYFSNEYSGKLMDFSKKLLKVGLNEAERVETRQTSLYGLQLVVRHAASHVSEQKSEHVLSSVVQLVHAKVIPDKVRSQALLVIAEVVGILKFGAVPHLTSLVQPIIGLISEDQEMDYLVMAALTVVFKLVENVPQFLSPFLPSLLCSVCHLSAVKEEVASKESRLLIRLSSVRNATPEHVEARIFIPAFTEAFKTLSKNDLPAIQPLLEMADVMLTKTDKKSLPSHVPDLLTLFMGALEIRTERGDMDVICQVEMSVISTLVRLLLRLNEHNNLAIFTSLYRWAVESNDDKPSRLVTFYRFADHLANTLKVLFLKARLADVFFTHSISLLEQNNTYNSKKTTFGSGKNEEKRASYLLTLVLDTLTKVFAYDSINFLNEDKFRTILEPLIKQLHNQLGGYVVTQDRIDNHLLPCIVKLTATTADDTLWKEINSEIFKRIRSENDPKIILSGLSVFRALAEGHGEDYLQPILPDVIPAITEILEHGDEEVEEASRNIFSMMEDMLGDQVRAYLND